jgi:hypothetical protein
MYKKPGNPKIEELTKSCKDRSYPLGYLNAIKIEENNKLIRKCAWCAEGVLRHGNQKYCTNDCSRSAMAWAYPQKEEGLFMLLYRQEWKCNVCQYDYRPIGEQIHEEIYRKYSSFGGAPHKFGEAYDWMLIKRLKNRVPDERGLDVDHIVPIFKGGQSIGLDNHQAICRTCHRTKTSKDLSKKSSI